MDVLWAILNTYVIRISRCQSYLLVGGLEEAGVEAKRDSNIHLFSMEILGSHRKVPIRWLQGDSEFPFGAFLLFANEISQESTNFSSISIKIRRRKRICLSQKSLV
jgi:hypothetical protein